jgi:8-oxo-dGTP diphosphatase
VLAVPTGRLELSDLSESDGHAWVPVSAVADLPLHPSFRTAWSAPDSALAEFVAAT